MKVSYVTSSEAGQIKIAFQTGDSPEVVAFEGTELKCLYEFHTLIVQRCTGRIVTFSCEKTNATQVWEQNWIEAYRADGFRTKPPNHRDVLKKLDDCKTHKGIEFRFKRITLKKKNELVSMINPKAVRQATPNMRSSSEDDDDPPQRRESIRDLIDRAIQRDRS
jgi:hypothetical protein